MTDEERIYNLHWTARSIRRFQQVDMPRTNKKTKSGVRFISNPSPALQPAPTRSVPSSGSQRNNWMAVRSPKRRTRIKWHRHFARATKSADPLT